MLFVLYIRRTQTAFLSHNIFNKLDLHRYPDSKMKAILALAFYIVCTNAFAQQNDYEPNHQYPYGRLNPSSPTGTGDFDMLIGTCECKSVSRNQDGSWQDTLRMEWQFKYIMNGTAVQDEVWRENDMMAGSIRQFNADSAKWYVSYYTNTNIPASLPAWSGSKNAEGNIVLYRDQKAPNGMEGFSRLTFYDISNNGFNWKGEWISKDDSVIYPYWMIFCHKKDSD